MVFRFPRLVLFLPWILFSSDLDLIAAKWGNEKGCDHNYLAIYDSYFTPLRNKELRLLEIGFATGASARMWETYFPKAELHYVDIFFQYYEYMKELSPRSHLHIFDQSNITALENLVEEVGEFDLIIDDGSHRSSDQIISFEFLFPHLKSGGIYVIEDLHTSYWQGFGGEGDKGRPKTSPHSITEFLKNLVDQVNYVGAYTGAANRDLAELRVNIGYDKHGTYNFPKDFFVNLNYYAKHIKSIHFYDSICFVLKW